MFYDTFFDLCKQKNIKPGRAADEIGINRATVTQWKKKGYAPRNDVLEKIAAYFDVTVDYLLGKSEYKNARDEAYQKEVEKLREYKKGHHLITTLGMGGDRQVDELTEDEYQAAMATVKAIRRAKGMPEE